MTREIQSGASACPLLATGESELKWAEHIFIVIIIVYLTFAMCMDFDTCYFYFSQPARHMPCFRGENRDSRKAPAGPELGLPKQAFEAHSIDSTAWSVHLLVMASLLVNLDRRGICSCLLSVALVFLWNESFFFNLYAFFDGCLFFFLVFGHQFRISDSLAAQLVSSVGLQSPSSSYFSSALRLGCWLPSLQLALSLCFCLMFPSLSRPRPTGSTFSSFAFFKVPIKPYFLLQTPCRM